MKRFGTISVFVDCKTGSLALEKPRGRRRRKEAPPALGSISGTFGDLFGRLYIYIYVCVCVCFF